MSPTRQSIYPVIAALAVLAVVGTAPGGSFAEELAGEEIMEKVDENEFIESARAETELIIIQRGREIKKEMITYVQSDREATNALAEFVNPRDRGTKYLLRDDELWMFFPDAEDLVRISGHMLKQNMMGSDFSYQDMLESVKLTDLYEFEKEKEDLINGRKVYVVKATAREGEDVAYYRRRMWVDSEKFIVLREEMYARDGRLLKEMISEDVREVRENRWLPMKRTMEDKLRRETKTVHRVNKIDLDYEIPPGALSLEALQ